MRATVTSAALVPQRLRAGRPATLRIVLVTAEPRELARYGRVACSASSARASLRVAKRQLQATAVPGRVTATCTWRTTKQAKGKRLQATLSVLYRGVLYARTITRTVS